MEDFIQHTGIKRMGEWGGVVQYGGGDSSMIVMFYLNPVRNVAKSNEVNRPFFDDKVFVRIHPPGERLNIIDREASDQDKKRFPMQWMQFQENKPQMSSGTPIDMLYPATPSIPASLKASGVHTIEQCSELSAHAIETIGMGAQQWVNDAKRYLQVANKGVKASELRAAMEEMERENRTLKHQLDLVKKELDKVRESANNLVTMDDVQKLLAQAGGSGARAIYPPGKHLAKSFDAQTAQINATHVTRDLGKGKKVAVASRRARMRST